MIRRNQTKRNVKRSSRAGVRCPTDRGTGSAPSPALSSEERDARRRADAPTRRRARDEDGVDDFIAVAPASDARRARDDDDATAREDNDDEARDEARDGDDEEEEAARARTMTLARDARTRGAEREGDDAETQSRGKKRARRKRDDAGRRDARTTFGGFATLPTELVVKIMKELDGYSLAMATCAGVRP